MIEQDKVPNNVYIKVTQQYNATKSGEEKNV